MLLGIPRISFKITGGMSAVLRLFLDEIMHQYEYKKKTPGSFQGCFIMLSTPQAPRWGVRAPPLWQTKGSMLLKTYTA